MYSLNGSHYSEDCPGPKSADPDITNRIRGLIPNTFKTLVSLSGAAPGLYVIFYPVQGVPVYVGPFAAMFGIIMMARWIFGFGHGLRATHYEITEHRQQDD